jgi:hypothetical protein
MAAERGFEVMKAKANELQRLAPLAALCAALGEPQPVVGETDHAFDGLDDWRNRQLAHLRGRLARRRPLLLVDGLVHEGMAVCSDGTAWLVNHGTTALLPQRFRVLVQQRIDTLSPSTARMLQVLRDAAIEMMDSMPRTAIEFASRGLELMDCTDSVWLELTAEARGVLELNRLAALALLNDSAFDDAVEDAAARCGGGNAGVLTVLATEEPAAAWFVRTALAVDDEDRAAAVLRRMIHAGDTVAFDHARGVHERDQATAHEMDQEGPRFNCGGYLDWPESSALTCWNVPYGRSPRNTRRCACGFVPRKDDHNRNLLIDPELPATACASRCGTRVSAWC